MPPRKREPADMSETVTVTADPAPTPKPKYIPVRIRGHQVKLAVEGRNSFDIVCPADHSLEQARDLQYLWDVHTRFKRGDVVTIRHPYFLWELEILIREIDTEACAIVGYHRVRDFSEEELQVPDLSDATVSYLGGPNAYVVAIGSITMKTGFETEGEAWAWLRKKQSRGN